MEINQSQEYAPMALWNCRYIQIAKRHLCWSKAAPIFVVENITTCLGGYIMWME